MRSVIRIRFDSLATAQEYACIAVRGGSYHRALLGCNDERDAVAVALYQEMFRRDGGYYVVETRRVRLPKNLIPVIEPTPDVFPISH
jgi:hypothetical protein